MTKKQKKSLRQILIAAALLAVLAVVPAFPGKILLYLLPYVAVGTGT